MCSAGTLHAKCSLLEAETNELALSTNVLLYLTVWRSCIFMV